MTGDWTTHYVTFHSTYSSLPPPFLSLPPPPPSSSLHLTPPSSFPSNLSPTPPFSSGFLPSAVISSTGLSPSHIFTLFHILHCILYTSLPPVSTPLVSYHKMTKEDELSDSEEEEGEEEMKEVVEGGTSVEKNFKLKMRTEKKQKGTSVKEKVINQWHVLRIWGWAVSSGQSPWRVLKVKKEGLVNAFDLAFWCAFVGNTNWCNHIFVGGHTLLCFRELWIPSEKIKDYIDRNVWLWRKLSITGDSVVTQIPSILQCTLPPWPVLWLWLSLRYHSHSRILIQLYMIILHNN